MGFRPGGSRVWVGRNMRANLVGRYQSDTSFETSDCRLPSKSLASFPSPRLGCLAWSEGRAAHPENYRTFVPAALIALAAKTPLMGPLQSSVKKSHMRHGF